MAQHRFGHDVVGELQGGAGGIPFGPPDPKIAIPICETTIAT